MKNFEKIPEMIAIPSNPERGINSFHIGKYPVTQAQWIAIALLPKIKIGLYPVPSYFKGENMPVETVNYYEAVEACARLSALTGREYRLPTEAEWEHACLAGAVGDYCFGDDAKQLGDYAWFDENSGGRTHPVGQKKPNAWGVHDMHGNVLEWCAEIDDGCGLQRGGSWLGNHISARATWRFFNNPRDRFYFFGFRVVVGGRPESKESNNEKLR
jgi:formylglycine-generating enzyme required for sulfatase activity